MTGNSCWHGRGMRSNNGFPVMAVIVENNTALASYTFDAYQPILIIFVDNKVVLFAHCT